MTALVCDICGGKLSMGSGGIAACDSCGMEHTKERMQEKVQEIKGTVRVDNSHMIDNYFTMAENAYEADNKAESENYCNKIIEIDPESSTAWLLKGKAAGWQSTIANIRLNEAATCFAKAIDLASEDEVDDIKTQSTDEIKDLSLALISLRGNRFAQYPDEEEASGFLNDIEIILNTVITLANKSGAITTGFMEEVACIINQSVVSAWVSKIEPDYVGIENRPDEYAWRQLIDRIGYCTMLVDKAIELSEDDDEENIQRYEILISLHQKASDSCSWKEVYNSLYKNWEWKHEYLLADSAKSLRRQMISDYKNRIIQIKDKKSAEIAVEKVEKERIAKEEANRRFKQYWNSHTEEKIDLENEKKAILENIIVFNADISKIQGNEDLQNIQERINKLNSEKSALGIFKVKERKTIQAQIAELSNQIKSIYSKMIVAKTEIEDKIRRLQNRINTIDTELTMAR